MADIKTSKFQDRLEDWKGDAQDLAEKISNSTEDMASRIRPDRRKVGYRDTSHIDKPASIRRPGQK